MGVPVNNVSKVIIWGNHSSTQFPDVSNAAVVTASGDSKSVHEAINDEAWLTGDFISVSSALLLLFSAIISVY